MPRNFEGNLAHALPENDAKPSDRKSRSSGFLAKDKWKTLEGQEEIQELSPDDLEVIQEKPIDLSDEVKEEDSAQAFSELQTSDEIKKARIEERKKKAQDLLGELASSDQKKKGERAAHAEKARIEKQHAENMKAIQEGFASREAAASAEHAEDTAFLNSREGREAMSKSIRESMKDELEAIRKENSVDGELEMGADGKIRGLKNLPLVSWTAFRQAMGGRMNAIKDETILLLEQPSNAKRDERLKALEAESAEWMQMYQDGKLMEDGGAGSKDIHIHNRLYKQIDLVVPEGLTQAKAETLAITPEQELQKRLEFLAEQDAKLSELIQQAGEVLWNIDDTDESKAALQQHALTEFLRGVENYRTERKAGVAQQVELLRTLESPDKLDLRSQKLGMLKKQAEDKINSLRAMLGRTKEAGSITVAKEAIDSLEEKTTGYQEDLSTWHNHPARQDAMEARRMEVEDQIEQLEYDERRLDFHTRIHVQDPKALVESNFKDKGFGADAQEKAKAGMDAYRTRVSEAKNRIHQLVREKADIATERAAIINERVDRELEQLEVTVDLSELKEDEIEVDTSDFEAPAVSKPSKIETPRSKAVGKKKAA